MRINVGLSKKIGLPGFGSVGASCTVEFEADQSTLQTDLDAFHRHVRSAYTACRQAVQDELSKHQTDGATQSTGNAAAPNESRSQGAASEGTDGNGRSGSNGGGPQRASQNQLEYIQQLARQIRGLGVRRLEALAQKMFGKPIAELSTLDASGLIDTLKAAKAGEIDLEAALQGATP
jgi:hypothetical protein